MTEEQVRELMDSVHHSVIAASVNFDLWMAYERAAGNDVQAPVLNQRDPVNQAMIDAHLVSAVVYLCDLFSLRGGAATLFSVIFELKAAGWLDSKTDRYVSDFMNTVVNSNADKLLRLRESRYGRQSRKKSVEAAFSESGLSFEQLEALIEKTGLVFSELDSAFGEALRHGNDQAPRWQVTPEQHLAPIASAS